jgi:hypothetical protein
MWMAYFATASPRRSPTSAAVRARSGARYLVGHTRLHYDLAR